MRVNVAKEAVHLSTTRCSFLTQHASGRTRDCRWQLPGRDWRNAACGSQHALTAKFRSGSYGKLRTKSNIPAATRGATCVFSFWRQKKKRRPFIGSRSSIGSISSHLRFHCCDIHQMEALAMKL